MRLSKRKSSVAGPSAGDASNDIHRDKHALSEAELRLSA
jgi:hypothetical protein